jgi:hypothetical protein
VVALITFGLVRSRAHPQALPPVAETVPAPQETAALQPAPQPPVEPAPAVSEPKKIAEAAPRVVRPAAHRPNDEARPSAAAAPVPRNDANDAAKPPEVAVPPAAPQAAIPAPAEDELPDPSNRNAIGSPTRQKELAQSYNSARLLITSPAVPEFLTIIVSVDNELLYRHVATAAPVFVLENGQRRLEPRAAGAIPLAEELALPPGRHKFRVHILMAARRVGRPQEVADRFFSGQRHTLDIQFFPLPQGSGDPEGNDNRFSVSLR